MTPQTVLLIPPNDIGWLSLQQAVASLPDVQIETASGDAAAIAQIALDLRPDAIITTARLGDAPITPILRHLRRRLRTAIFIIVDHDVDPDALPDLAQAGVSAYLLWSHFCNDDLRPALEVALAGKAVVLSNEVAETYDRIVREPSGPASASPPLSDREFHVLRLLATGQARQDIADALDISPRTVDRIIDDLKAAFDAPTREALMVTAVRLGIVR
ncbi:MAG: LuxR C-terminal-related transcriptional regulator [Thermomicrobiales bacterium]|nr:LuxR C-terminal-related transcriptional regulator [Thermomicrobiales bacterium]